MKISRNFRRSSARARLACLALLLVAGGLAASTARIFVLSADEWARPRSGAMLAELAPVRGAVAYWNRGVDAVMLIRYPGGDSGEIWAAELRDWLVSLGVPSDYILFAPGTQSADQIELVVGSRDELEH